MCLTDFDGTEIINSADADRSVFPRLRGPRLAQRLGDFLRYQRGGKGIGSEVKEIFQVCCAVDPTGEAACIHCPGKRYILATHFGRQWAMTAPSLLSVPPRHRWHCLSP